MSDPINSLVRDMIQKAADAMPEPRWSKQEKLEQLISDFNPDFEEGQEFCVWPVARDEAYIDTMLGKVMAFWAALERGILPSEAMWEQSVNGVYAAF